MNKVYSFSQLQALLNPAQSIFVVLPETPLFDHVASGLALFLSLEKAGKQVLILCQREMTVDFSHLVGVDKVTRKPAGGDLVLTITPIENVEKVSSLDEEGKLNLIIRSKPGAAPIKKENIIFSSTGASADLIFVVGAKKLENLGKIYQENESLLRGKPIVNIGCHPQSENFGQVSFWNPQASSCAEITVAIISDLGLPVDEDIGSNLLLGLSLATQNFQNQSTTPEAFEAAAFCLRAGARKGRFQPSKEEKKESPPVTPSADWLEPKIYKGSTLP